jgi:hypothetical protein
MRPPLEPSLFEESHKDWTLAARCERVRSVSVWRARARGGGKVRNAHDCGRRRLSLRTCCGRVGNRRGRPIASGLIDDRGHATQRLTGVWSATAAVALSSLCFGLAACGSTTTTTVTTTRTVVHTQTRYGTRTRTRTVIHRSPAPPASTVTTTVTQTQTAAAATSTSAGPAVEGPGSVSHATDAQFCSTHQCIPNFPNGNGSIVQCVDGEWSHSGGLSGACSDHGGEA